MAEYVNNHIHTTFSFSPYTPAAAAEQAKECGLTTAGIMDHDSIGGAFEFIEAGKGAGIATTVGFECRVNMDGTPFAGRRINNPDQNSVAYVACHGIPHQNIEAAQNWLAPYRRRRNVRNRNMVDNINRLVAPAGIALDFDTDVLPISQAERGGSVTERHILFALAEKIIAAKGRGPGVPAFLADGLGMALSEKNRAALANGETPFYDYALLGALKSGMVEQFYIDATDELPDVREFTAFAASIGAVPAYAYLGDVGDSVTGDKKPQKFEDDYLDELVPWLAANGFFALTFMPTRNTKPQLARVMAMCDANGLFQISGEDINSPTQSFICKALEEPEFEHLVTSTWALIGHELAATKDINHGMFSKKTIETMPNLHDRIIRFAKAGREAHA